MKTNLKIGSLHVNFQNASGQEHRLAPVAGRAARIFSARLGQSMEKLSLYGRHSSVASLTADPIDFDLRGLSDDEAAHRVASAWLDAVVSEFRRARRE